ncbi:hypothetical protein TRVL_09166 [Trypanosoma vivax]|nr:hypothetical protein TRVL_09166 [Trypanosoma vivax]
MWQCVQAVVLAGLARAHASRARYDSETGDEADTVAARPLLQRSLQCPYCPVKCALKQYLTMRLHAKRGLPKRDAKHNSLKVGCKESAAHLLECPSLRELRKKHRLEAVKGGEMFFSAQLDSFLKELFKLESPSACHT